MAVTRSIQRLFYPAALLALFTAGCGDTPTQPTQDPPLTIACPTNQTQPATNGVGALVSYPAATAAGGVAPLTVACNPPSPNFFQAGTTPVTCIATDAKNKTNSCTFQVTVTTAPRISATSLIGFGDSISDGVLGLTTATGPGDPGPTVGYVYKLRSLLQARYVAQTIVMTDEGCPGEMVSTATSNPGCTSQGGIYRLPTALSRDRPQAMILLEGINDLNGSGGDAINTVISGLRTMVRQGRGSGIPVFLSTILPERPGGSRSHPGAIVAIPPTNDQIKQLAVAEGAYLVDMFAAFDGQTGTLLGPDGLHPNDAGYTKMAQVFFDAIKSKLEVTSSPTMQFPFPIAR